MSISNLLRRTLIHYSRCSSHLTLPPLDLEARKPGWAKNIGHFYREDRFHPLTVMDPSYLSFPVILEYQEENSIALFREDTGAVCKETGQFFHSIPNGCVHAQLMVCNQNREHPVTVVVPDGIFHMVQPLANRRDQFDALCSYCRMSEQGQTVVRKFLTDPEAAANLFHCLCFLASHLIRNNCEMEMLNIPALTDIFNRVFAPRLQLASVDPEEMRSLVHALKFSAIPMSDELYNILTFCAILNCCSRMQEHSSSVIYALSSFSENHGIHVDFLLPWCSCSDMLRKIIREALHQVQRSNSLHDFSESLLLLCLNLPFPLPEDCLEDILSQMFSGELSIRQKNSIGTLLDSPNGPYVRKFIRRKYQQLWPTGQYLQAIAGIRSHQAGAKKAQAAQNLMLDSPEEADALIGAAMLTQYLRNEQSLPVVLDREEQILKKLSQWLLTSDAYLYNIACELTMALKLSCAISRRTLCDEEIVENACRHFFREDSRSAAIRFLATLPLCHTIDHAENLELIREEGKWLFQKALEEKLFPDMTLLFRACFQFRCWNDQELSHICRQLANAEQRFYTFDQNRSEKNLINQTREELLSIRFSGRIPTEKSHWECLTGSLSHQMHHRLEKILHAAAQGQPVVLSSSEDVMLVLRYLRHAGTDRKMQAEALAEHCTPAETVADSCLVSWFWVLCCWNRRREAMDYYLSHRSLLDRPWCSSCERTPTLDWKNFRYADFLSTPSRLQMGIYLATLLHNFGVVSEFLHSGVLSGYAANAAANVFQELSLCVLPKELKFLSSQGLDLETDPVPDNVRSWILEKMLPLNLYEFWRICWDDRGLTRMVLTNAVNSHDMVFPLGYRGEKEMVIPAVIANPSCTYVIAPHLLRDDEIALAVLGVSPFPLRSLRAPILRDHELVMDMIRAKNVYPPLDKMPDWLCGCREFVIRSLPKKPSCYHLVYPQLKADPQVLLAAMCGLSANNTGYICNLLREADPVLRSNKEVMSIAIGLCPDSYYMAAEHLRTDPSILALLPKDFFKKGPHSL